jgi:hypothetical protein
MTCGWIQWLVNLPVDELIIDFILSPGEPILDSINPVGSHAMRNWIILGKLTRD